MSMYVLTITGRLAAVNRQTESAIRALRRLPYREYLRTFHWRRTRELALERAGYQCALCPAREQLAVHHRSYLRLGFEQPQDLIVLCRECHETHHRRLRVAVIRVADALGVRSEGSATEPPDSLSKRA